MRYLSYGTVDDQIPKSPSHHPPPPSLRSSGASSSTRGGAARGFLEQQIPETNLDRGLEGIEEVESEEEVDGHDKADTSSP